MLLFWRSLALKIVTEMLRAISRFQVSEQFTGVVGTSNIYLERDGQSSLTRGNDELRVAKLFVKIYHYNKLESKTAALVN